MKYKVAVMGLNMGGVWAEAAYNLADTELTLVYDPGFDSYAGVHRQFILDHKIPRAATEDEIYASDADVIIIASPDHFHADQCVKALRAGKHVVCEKPLAPTLADCRRIIDAVRASGKNFMTGQVCRYAPGFRTAKTLYDAGRIGELVFLESEYAHDYTHLKDWNMWRTDSKVKRQGFLGGGCHALDLLRWFAGNPLEIACLMNHKLLPAASTPDTGICIAKFPNDVMGKMFVSTGARRPYTMRTCIYGTKGTIICDNTTPYIEFFDNELKDTQKTSEFIKIPVSVASHNVKAELEEFIACLKAGKPCPTDVLEGTRTVAFAEAAIRAAETGAWVKVEQEW